MNKELEFWIFTIGYIIIGILSAYGYYNLSIIENRVVNSIVAIIYFVVEVIIFWKWNEFVIKYEP